MAENEQDSYWITDFYKKFEFKNTLGNFINLIIGEFNSDGVLKIYTDEFIFEEVDVEELPYIYVQRPGEDFGDEGYIVGIELRSLGIFTTKSIIKRIEKDLLFNKNKYRK